MIYNKHLYVRRIREVALKLDYLLSDVVFVGGAVVALYADDPAAEEVRPTDDIDIAVSIFTYAELSVFEEKIRSLGFRNAPDARFISRYKINEIVVDVMPVNESVLGFSNQWYEEGMEESVLYTIDHEVSIRLMPFHYFIASKIEAHNSRGGNDLRQSKDFEDIVYSFDNRLDPLADMQKSTGGVRKYLRQQMNAFLKDSNFHEGVYSHLNPGSASSRLRRIKGIWSTFASE